MRQSESAVLDILLDEHFMSFFTALVFLLLKFWKGSKCIFFVSNGILCFYLAPSLLFILSSFNLFILGIVHSCFRSNSYYFFVNSCDEQVACQMILDKKGLKGYQVIHISPWNSFWWCYVVVLGLGWDKEALPMYPVCHGGTSYPTCSKPALGQLGVRIQGQIWGRWSKWPSVYLNVLQYSVTNIW